MNIKKGKIIALVFALCITSFFGCNRVIPRNADIENSSSKSVSDLDFGDDSPNELTNYFDLSIETLAQKIELDVTTISEGVYLYTSENRNEILTVYTDSSGNIEAIKIVLSGDAEYSLVGLKSGVSNSEADVILSGKGFERLSENLWADDNYNVVMIEADMIVFERNSPRVSEESLREHTEYNFTPIHDDSKSFAYIGKGQTVELLHDSFSEFSYNFSKLTDYQKTNYGNEIYGRYIMLSGTVEKVSSNGTISVYCDKYERENEMFLEGRATGNVKLLSQQHSILYDLNSGDTIVLFARIKPNTYDMSLFGTASFDLYDGIVAKINGAYIDIPLLENVSEDIQRYIPTDYLAGFGI